MATQARVAPFINKTFYITSEWWEQPRNHKGLDLSTGANDPIYSMTSGTVVRAEYSGTANTGYGWVVIIKDNNNMGYLYAHMRDQPLVSLGDSVIQGQQIGIEGTTGESTGIHLHVEMQDLTNHAWDYTYDKSLYSNPATFMGLPNVEGTECYYDGNPYIPPEPTPIATVKKHKFNFLLFNANKRRNLYN